MCISENGTTPVRITIKATKPPALCMNNIVTRNLRTSYPRKHSETIDACEIY
jgi:hypothetical protein